MKPAVRRIRLWPSILVSMAVFAVLTLVAFKPSPADRGEFSGVLHAILVGHLKQANAGSANSHTPPGFSLLAAPLLWPFGALPPTGAVNVVGVAIMGILIPAVLELGQALGIRLTNRTSLYVLLPIVVTPAATASIDDFFHPQDLLATALVVLGIALGLRQRPVAAGVMLGLAVLTKQWAVLAVIPIVFTRRTSVAARMVLASSIAFGIGIAPFDPALFLYYFVPTSVLLVVLESSYQRPPFMASAWIAVTTDMWYGPGKGGTGFTAEVAILFLLMIAAIAVPAKIALTAPPCRGGITPFRFARPAAGSSRRSSRSRRRS